MVFNDSFIAPPKSTNQSGESEGKVIGCIPFSYGRYKDLQFEGVETLHSGKAVYVFCDQDYGEFAFEKETLNLIWQTREIPEKLLGRIQQCLDRGKRMG